VLAKLAARLKDAAWDILTNDIWLFLIFPLMFFVKWGRLLSGLSCRGGIRMARRRIAEAAILYTIGSLGYCLLELSWRGYTHWSMAVTGGICFFLLYQIDARFSRRTLFWRCFAGALAVTAVEFAVGCVVNLALGWGVWDYSRMPMQLWGQICLPFFLLWFLLCIPVLGVTGMLRCSLFRKEEGRAP